MNNLSPRQIIFFGCLLAFGASFLNTGFLIESGVSVSHMTGDISKIATESVLLDSKNINNLFKVLTATGGFICGAVFSGYVLHHPTLEISLPYGRILSFLGLLLVSSYLIYPEHLFLTIYICSFVCGAQNALASRFRGTVLRTTHLTGLFTELGIFTGMKLKGYAIESWKITIPLYLSLSFFTGAVVSSLLVLRVHDKWLLIAGCFYTLVGLLTVIFKRLYTARNLQR